MKKTVRAIISSSSYSGDSCSSIKRHIKQAMSKAPKVLPSDSPTDHTISFHEKEVIELCQSHDDTLVISLPIANSHVEFYRSSADILFLSALREMNIDEVNFQKASTILVGFKGEGTKVVGKIQLPFSVGGENRLTTFLILSFNLQHHPRPTMDTFATSRAINLSPSSSLPNQEKHPGDQGRSTSR
ncbi:hypothetical protein TIFTF001_029499 [Ficus carica]|uniref:Uncharacterized protein n=1 Tax=Ficus carica TaxID=3494 RepID=A0AA88J2X8_FICCA|nr:hypothetical protein TIFTF001_029499 [Ficus carica]